MKSYYRIRSLAMQFEGLIVGVPREIMPGEKRVALTPEVVMRMSRGGAQVIIENDAGRGAYFRDEDYEEAGARIVRRVEEVYEAAQVILKVKEPRYDEQTQRHETDLLREGQWLISFLHPAAPANHDMVEMLAGRRVVALTLDGIPRITRAQTMDALTSMSTVAGYKAVLMAAGELCRFI
ncbi:MAG TPA: NAD(P)(+) transhydrogenase (Re/Si-specific) subunit alpha, partial [Candidatus Hydrogenedentes bacterium]|nr:NAD(P)(+) transhydrogenase (Re/Si-specific) subunit alpha [Candidatus Hydrogenedentota bacterium]